jgi:Flp pilus assembly pilin Flp
MLKHEDGQTFLEYALVFAVLILVIIGTIPTLRNSVTQVYQRTQEALSDDHQEKPPVWTPTKTILGTGPVEIAYNLTQLMIDYRKANNKFPPKLVWDSKTQTWSGEDVAWKTILDWRYPGEKIDIEQWRRKNNVDGIIYAPHGNLVSIEPAPDYQLHFKDVNGKSYDLEYNERTGVAAILNISRRPEDQRWFAGMYDGNGKYFEVNIDIESLHASGPGMP